MSLVASVMEWTLPREGSIGSFSGGFQTRKSLRPEGAPSSVISSMSYFRSMRIRIEGSLSAHLYAEYVFHVLLRLGNRRTAGDESRSAICHRFLRKTVRSKSDGFETYFPPRRRPS